MEILNKPTPLDLDRNPAHGPNPATGNRAGHSPSLEISSQIATLLMNARTLFRFDEIDMAFALVRSALQLDSQNCESLKLLSEIFTRKKDWPKAITAFQALHKHETSFASWAGLGLCYYELGQDELSLKSYENALPLASEVSALHFEIYKNMGNICCRQQDFQAAEEYYCKAFTLNTKSDILLVNLGTLEIQRGDFETALLRMRAAVEINPQNDRAWVGLALVHNEFGDFELSRANVQKAVELNPANRTAVHIMSSWAAQDHQYHLAIPVLQDFLATTNFDEEMSLALIHLFIQTNQFEKADLELERILLWNPQHQGAIEMKRHLPRWS